MRQGDFAIRIAGLCLLALSAVASAAGTAQPGLAILHADTRQLALREQLELVRNDDGLLTIDDVISDRAAGTFRPADPGAIAHGITPAAYWYRVTLRNDGPVGANANWVLEVDYPPLDAVDFYIRRGSQIEHVATGDQRPISPGQLRYRDYAVALPLPPAQRAELFLRVQTQGSHQVPLTLWSQEAFRAKATAEGFAFGVFFGVMLIMAAYNLVIFAFVRDRAYLYYVATLLSFTLLQANQSGYMYQFLQPMLGEARALNNRAVVVLGCMTMALFLMFARSFLQSGRNTPRMHAVMTAAIAVIAVFLPAGLWVGYGRAVVGLGLLGTGVSFVLIAAGIAALRAQVRTAQLYLAAWGVLIGSVLIKTLELFGLVLPTGFTAHAWQGGGLFTVFLLSLALADRINAERKEKIAAQADALTAREEAIASLARYQRIVDNVFEGVFEAGTDWRVLNANPALAAMLGYVSVDEMKLVVRDLRDHFVDPREADALTARLRAEGHVNGQTVQLRRRDRSLLWAEISIRQALDDGEHVAGVQGIVQDISERREKEQLTQARAAAEAATAAKSDFLAKMSHELRTPMNAIIGFSDLALRSDSDERRLEHIGHIRNASRSLLNIINDILDLSKIEAGKLTLEHRPFDLDVVLAHVRALLQPQAAARGLALTVLRTEATPAALVGDALRLEQVLINLVGNAVKFTERGDIELTADLGSATRDRARLRFLVRDTGIGLTEDEQGRLFTPFSQADAFATRRHGGTGLGLAISKQLVEKMGGRIAVESRPGVGSVFLFTAEFALGAAGDAPAPAAPAPAASAPRTAVLRGARVLLVEDNALNRQLAGEVLQPTGVLLDLAVNGPEAIEAVRRTVYDAVLMDVQMPGMDGLEATRRIRALPGGATLPIVALTANAMERDRQDCLAAGMNDFLSKPIDSDLLLVTLSHWVGGAVAPLSATLKATTAEQPALAPATLPAALPGIELGMAIGRLGGRENLVLDVLHGMLRQYEAGANALRRNLADGKADVARIDAHTLKGLAATAGCMRLSAAARSAELAIKSSGDIEAALAEVDAALQEVRASAQRLPVARPKPRPARAAEIDVAAELARFAGLLRSNDSAAQEQLELLLPALRARHPADVLEHLARAVHVFDYEAASAVLESLSAPAPLDGPAPPGAA